MPEQKTYDEILEEARKVFGPKAEVSFNDGQWLIATGIEEKFNALAVKDEYPHAFEASEEYEANYGSTLDRWAAKNGMGWASELEIFKAYEEHVVSEFKKSLALVRKAVEEGRTFDWEGGEEYKANVLRIAEERGW
jgi:hypothetical protein